MKSVPIFLINAEMKSRAVSSFHLQTFTSTSLVVNISEIISLSRKKWRKLKNISSERARCAGKRLQILAGEKTVQFTDEESEG
jgi:3-deoxy-D-manno-octulosonic-acid transferase